MKLFTHVLFVIALFIGPYALAQRDPAGYERFLLPVYVFATLPMPGAFGSVWVTEFTARNESDVPLQFFQRECSYFCECGGQTTCRPNLTIAPRTEIVTAVTRELSGTNPGVFLYAGKSGNAVLQLRARDISRSATSWGTELPVVRESEFYRDRSMFLLDIPIDKGFRQHLRMYGATSLSGGANLLVRLYARDTNDVLAERVVSLTPPDGADILLPDPFRPSLPAFAQIGSIADLLPISESVSAVRLEIAPLSPGLSFWAFVAVTNNETQHVTLATPQ